jgi:phosphoribosylanthranilate isomerase
MTRIKICGITNLEDARWAAQCGADAIGFVFADSPRRVTPEAAGEIVRELEPFVVAVGVFVDWPAERVREAMRVSGCAVAQLHGSETEEYIQSLAPYPAIKAMRVVDGIDRARRAGACLPDVALAELGLLPPGFTAARAILLDTYMQGKAGGTGRRFDLSVASALVREGWRVIVAGGLTAENVGEVVSQAKPYGVDVSTGVESAPGRKDPHRVAQFIAAARAADARRA